MRTRIIACDFDGTLYIDGAIAPEDCEALARWRAAGHLAVGATGKSIASVREAVEPHGVELDFYALYNGTAITDGQFRVLAEEHLPAASVRAIAEHFHGRAGLNVYVTTLTGPDALLWRGVEGINNPIIPDAQLMSLDELGEAGAGHAILLSVWAPGDAALQREVREWVTGNFDVDTSFNTGFFDIMPPGHNKGAGLTWLLDHLDLRRGDVDLYTFGDGHNDLSMHALADASFAPPHALPEVRDAVTHVVPSVAVGIEIAERLQA